MTTTTIAADERRFGSGGPTLRQMGEQELLERLRAIAEAATGSLTTPPGDDAAVWAPPAGVEVAISQDALVEGEDFARDWIAPRALGRRALNAALSDLAGMGARPAWCASTLCAAGDTEVEDVLEIQRGLVEAALAAGCAVAGGDVSDIAGPLVVDVSVGGTSEPGVWLRRDAGRPGDVLLVTGQVGAPAAGLRLLQQRADGDVRSDRRDAWVEALLHPVPRLDEGRFLVSHEVRCGGDVSDGLLVDAARTATSSGCRAELWLDRVPAASGLREAFGDDWIALAVAGGEDFELLAAAAPAVAARLRQAWPAGLAPLHEVGRLVPGDGVRLLLSAGGDTVPAPMPLSRHWR